MSSSPVALDLTCLDGQFAARMPAEEWVRVRKMRDSPTMLDALDAYHELLSPYFSDHLLLNKVVTEGRRFEMLVYLLYLEATYDAADPRSGLTAANFRRVCAAQGVCSPNRASMVLGLMRLAGFLTTRPAADPRVVQLVATPAFVEIVEGWNRAILSIIDTAAPGHALAAAHAALPGLGRGMRTHGARAALDGWHLLTAFPEARLMIDRDGGWMLLMHLTHESLKAGGREVISPVAVDLERFGKRFGVSRSHLRRLLEEVHAAGLLARPPRNGSDVQLQPELVASYITCMAAELEFYRTMTLAALRELRPG